MKVSVGTRSYLLHFLITSYTSIHSCNFIILFWAVMVGHVWALSPSCVYVQCLVGSGLKRELNLQQDSLKRKIPHLLKIKQNKPHNCQGLKFGTGARHGLEQLENLTIFMCILFFVCTQHKLFCVERDFWVLWKMRQCSVMDVCIPVLWAWSKFGMLPAPDG